MFFVRSFQYPSTHTQISNSVGSFSATGSPLVGVKVWMPSPDQMSETPLAIFTLSSYPMPMEWTWPSQMPPTWDVDIPGWMSFRVASRARAATSLAIRIRSIS